MRLHRRTKTVVLILLVAFSLTGCFRRGRRNDAPTTPGAVKKPPRGRAQKAKALVDFGTISGQMGKLKEAKKYFQEAIRHDPTNPEAHHGLGLVYAKMEQIHGAIPEFQKAIELNPRYSDAFCNLGLAYMKIQQEQLAFEKWQMSLKVNRNHGPTHLALGEYYKSKKDNRNAVVHLLEAIRIMPKAHEPHELLAFIYLDQRLHRSAAPELQEVLKLAPKKSLSYKRALYALGTVYHNENMLDKAAALYGKLLELEKHNVRALINLGSINFQRGELEKARMHFERAYALDTSNQWLASQLEKLGRLLRGRRTTK